MTQTDHTLRSRTYSWDDPLPAARTGMGMSGLAYMQAMIAGELPKPPIAHTLDFNLLEASEGRAVFGIQPSEFHYNPIGVIHGGLAATLLDSALGVAVHTTLPQGKGYTTAQLNINLTRPITATTGYLRAEAQVIHVGRTTATAEGRLVDEHGKLYAHATTTCLIFDITV